MKNTQSKNLCSQTPKPVPQNYKGYYATKPQAYDVISRKSEETPTKWMLTLERLSSRINYLNRKWWKCSLLAKLEHLTFKFTAPTTELLGQAQKRLPKLLEIPEHEFYGVEITGQCCLSHSNTSHSEAGPLGARRFTVFTVWIGHGRKGLLSIDISQSKHQ